jgi:hypothetical protein
MVCVTARRRLGDFEFCGGGEKPIPANDFAKNAGLGNGWSHSGSTNVARYGEGSF